MRARQMQKRYRHHGRASTHVNTEGLTPEAMHGLTKLLLAVEPEIPNNDDELTGKCNPEGS